MGKRITLGLLINQIDSGYSRLLISGVSDAARDNDADLIIFSGRSLHSPYGHEYQNNAIYEFIKPGTIDALVMASGTQCRFLSSDQFLEYTRRFGNLPTVSLSIQLKGVPSIVVDNKAGIFEAVEHYRKAHGYRRIAFLKGPEDNEEAKTRFQAYGEAVRRHGLEEDPELFIQCDFTAAGARGAMAEYLENHDRPDFQAILTANDEIAIAVSQLLHERGYSIPHDVAVIGFDNISMAQFMVPPLTTIGQPLYEQARAAGESAIRLLRGEPVKDLIVMPTRLILRTSCGCLPRAVLDLDELASRASLPGGPAASPDKQTIIERCLMRLSEKEFIFPDRVVRDLLEALLELTGTDGFIGFLHGALSDEITRKFDISAWQTLLTVLQEELTLSAHSPEERTALGMSFLKARALLAEMLKVEQGKGRIDLQGQIFSLRLIMERLISAASIGELMADLTDDLERLDIRSCLIAGYSPEIVYHQETEWGMPPHAEIMLAYADGERIALADRERFFSPSAGLMPPGLFPRDRRRVLVAKSLFFREDQIGYIVFELGDRDHTIYETFCVQLSNILKGSLLFMARQKAEERLRQVLVELEEYNQRLSGLSQTDELTGLLNRRGFLSLGRQSLTLARRMGRRGNVFFTDLDDLKKINDGWGHQEGDSAIHAAADILKKTFRTMDVIARLGGDEFAVLTVDTVPDFVESLKQRLQACISTYNADSGKPYALSMSIGAVPFEKESTVSLEELLDRADDVLYEEKKIKKSTPETRR
jgi:diguanylate cyclase (GGDEF)-like protein